MSETTAVKERVVIAGGSGFLGLNLARYLLERGYEVVILSRSEPSGNEGRIYCKWDGRTVGEWAEYLDGAKAVVNLAGRTVDCIKTPDHCDEILRSRVEATRAIGLALASVKQPPEVWVQMATAHIYGDPPEVMIDEDSAFGYGLAPTVGKAWEKAYREVVPPGMRQVILRTSFVLGKDGGALKTLAKLARFGLGGKVGHGRQGMSWIHENDMNALLLRGIENDAMEGVYIATAPEPVSNAVFMSALRKAVGMPIGLPAMGWMVKIGAPLIMRTDPELALYGRYCVSKRLAEEDFEFEFPALKDALTDLLKK